MSTAGSWEDLVADTLAEWEKASAESMAQFDRWRALAKAIIADAEAGTHGLAWEVLKMQLEEQS
jgi:hypothetical protein